MVCYQLFVCDFDVQNSSLIPQFSELYPWFLKFALAVVWEKVSPLSDS